MRKRVFIAVLIISFCISVQGCGKISNQNNADNANNETQVSTAPSAVISQKPQNNENSTDNNNIQDKETNKPYDSDSPDTSGTPGIPEDNVPVETPAPKPGKLSAKEQYSDAYRVIKFLGLKEYKTLKGDNYTDKADKNKKFLVLFLSIRNTSTDNDYINPNYISAKVDGKNIEHTFLVNDPKSYPTLFTNIEAGKTIGGFIVWEVPKNWKKFQMEYNAWKNIDGLVLTAKFTPDDLKDPIIYNANDFN